MPSDRSARLCPTPVASATTLLKLSAITGWLVLVAVTSKVEAGESPSLTVKVTISFSGSPITPETGLSGVGEMRGPVLFARPGVMIEPSGKLELMLELA